MKKILVLSALMGLITLGVVMAWCVETDNGDDPFNMEYTTYGVGQNNVTKGDFCFVPGVGPVNECFNVLGAQCRLLEYYCSASETLATHNYLVSHCLYGEAV